MARIAVSKTVDRGSSPRGPAMNVVIRRGTPQDFPQLLALVRELAEFEESSSGVKNSAQQMEQEQDEFDFFVAVDGTTLIGMAVFSTVYSTWYGKSLYLDDLYVREAYRNQKVGTRLLRAVFKFAKAESCHRLRWQVLDWNSNAMAFYRKIGADIDTTVQNCDFYEDTMGEFLLKTAALD